METIANAIRRRTRNGADIGADQRLTLPEALRAHTVDAAVALGLEDRLGRLAPGMLADVTIVDGDLFAAPVEGLADLPIWLTMVDGRVRHSAGAGAV